MSMWTRLPCRDTDKEVSIHPYRVRSVFPVRLAVSMTIHAATKGRGESRRTYASTVRGGAGSVEVKSRKMIVIQPWAGRVKLAAFRSIMKRTIWQENRS